MRSSLSQPAQSTGTGGTCRSTFKPSVPLHRCPQHQHVASRSISSKVRDPVGAAAAAAEVTAPAPATAAEPVSVAEQTVDPQAGASQQGAQQSRRPRSLKQRREGDEEGSEPGAIIVLEKPVTNSIVRRLAEVPQAVLRAGRPDDATTYRAVAAVAAAQKQLAASNKVAVYVPYTKAARFTAQLLTADSSILDTITSAPLTVRASTDAAALGNTLAFTLLRDGGATVASAGASATAKAAEALRVARALLLKKGFEIGVVPQFADSIGNQGQQITILRQEVVSKEMPPPEVVAPSNPSKSLAPTAAAAASLLARQRRCTLKIRQGQLFRLTELLFTTAQPKGRAPAAPEAAVAAAGPTAAAADTAAAAAAEAPQAAAGVDAGGGRDSRAREAQQAMKPRLLLVSYVGTSPATPGPNSVSSSSKPQDTPAALEDAAAASAAAGDTADTTAAAAADDAAAKSPASAAAAAVEVPGSAFVTLDLQRSRFTTIPEPRWGLAGPGGPLYAKKPVVVTADSSAAGVAGALESKLYRLGAAWLYTDGSVAGNRTAWEAYATLGRKLAGKASKAAVLALVKAEQDLGNSKSQGSSSSREGKAAAEQQQQQQESQQEEVEGSQQQQQQQQGQGSKQQQKGSGYRLSMLLVHDEDVQRSIMQAPNAPLESSRVAFKQALQLIKFTAAVNCFLPVNEASGTGGLVLLPAVLPAATAAVDYRFAGTDRAQGAAYDYYFRVQRLTNELPAGGLAGPEVQQLRVSPGTDPSKLRDAIVAKMLTGQPATLRFAAPAGLLPDFMLSVAMTAVAAARVRLQAKGAAVDVAVMPLVLQDTRGPSSKGAEGGGRIGGGKGWDRFGDRVGGKGPRESKSVVYSLRLVPMPAAVADEAQMPLTI